MADAEEVTEIVASLKGPDWRADGRHVRFVENRLLAYDILRKWHGAQRTMGRERTITWHQLAVEYYDDIGVDTPRDDVRRRFECLRRMLRDLSAVGLVAWGPLCSAEGVTGARGQRQRGGKTKSLWFELRDVEAALDSVRSGTPAGIAQSVRAAES